MIKVYKILFKKLKLVEESAIKNEDLPYFLNTLKNTDGEFVVKVEDIRVNWYLIDNYKIGSIDEREIKMLI